MEKVKGQLLEALSAKGEGLLETGEQDQEKLLQIYTDLLKYTDVNDSKVGAGNINICTFATFHFRCLGSCGNCSGARDWLRRR